MKKKEVYLNSGKQFEPRDIKQILLALATLNYLGIPPVLYVARKRKMK